MDVMLQRILELIPSKHGAKKELADAVGFPANLITEWKAGRNKSYPKYAPKIAEYYGVSLDWLSGNSDIRETKKPTTNEDDELSPLDAEFNQNFSKLTEQEKHMVLASIKGILLNRE